MAASDGSADPLIIVISGPAGVGKERSSTHSSSAVDEMLTIIAQHRRSATIALYTDKPLQEADLWLAPTTR
jgi:hypothetical protein